MNAIIFVISGSVIALILTNIIATLTIYIRSYIARKRTKKFTIKASQYYKISSMDGFDEKYTNIKDNLEVFHTEVLEWYCENYITELQTRECIQWIETLIYIVENNEHRMQTEILQSFNTLSYNMSSHRYGSYGRDLFYRWNNIYKQYLNIRNK